MSSRWARIVSIGVFMGVAPLLATDCYWDYAFTKYHRNPDWDPTKPECKDRHGFQCTEAGGGRQRSVSHFIEAGDSAAFLKNFTTFVGRKSFPFVARILKPEHSMRNHPERRLANIMWRLPREDDVDARGMRVLTLETELGFYTITITQFQKGKPKTSLSKSEGQKLLDDKLAAMDNVFGAAYKKLMEAETRTGNDRSVYLSTADTVLSNHRTWMQTWPSDKIVEVSSLQVPRLPESSSPPSKSEPEPEDPIHQESSRVNVDESTTNRYVLVLPFVVGIIGIAMMITSCFQDPKSVKKLRNKGQDLEEAPRSTRASVMSDGSCCEESV